MNDNDIYRISYLISEDPDLVDDEWGTLIEYTNSMGETKEYRVNRAWPRFYRRALIGYNIEWPNGSFGFFKLDGLSSKSYEFLKSKYGAEDQLGLRTSYGYRAARRERKKSHGGSKPGAERRARWNYMFKTYGRCCPQWHYPGHVATVGDCWQADEMGRSIAPSVPNPHDAKLYEGSFAGDTVKIQQLDDYWQVTLSGEEPELFHDTNSAMEYIEERLSPPDLDDLRDEFDEFRYEERGRRRDSALQNQPTPTRPEPPATKTIESDYGPINITKLPNGNIEISMEGEEPIEFEEPRAASQFLRNNLGIEHLVECKKPLSKILSESIGPDDITKILTELGYSNIEFKVPSDEDFQRIDVFGGAFLNDKLYQLGEPMTDIPEEKLRQAIARIEAGGLKELTDEDMEEMEELENDAYLFVIASKQVGNKFVGITLMSLDDPNMQFDLPNWQGDDEGDAPSVDDLESMFNAPAFDPGH